MLLCHFDIWLGVIRSADLVAHVINFGICVRFFVMFAVILQGDREFDKLSDGVDAMTD